jgi:hypothetical protein
MISLLEVRPYASHHISPPPAAVTAVAGLSHHRDRTCRRLELAMIEFGRAIRAPRSDISAGKYQDGQGT